ncbi:MAG: aspartyl/asparaginyl beta-hydroxylase [Candidatus Solibacter sp.]|nr:aspartyl/asparaginyl beta-hydroxylase [Candidatus Solibacter sp.]
MSLEGWVPAAVLKDEVEWRYLPGQRFTDPFFEDTLRRNPSAPVRRTTLAEAAEWVAAHPGLEPAGFIFHLSRCGSTLVAQMLASVEENRVMSEPAPLDQALGLGDPAMLRTIIGALGRANARETRLFVKLDCWHMHQYAVIRNAFPDTPAIFLYRDPLEVLVSQMRNPGMWTIGPPEIPRERHVAGLLAGILESAVVQADSLRLVNYTQLPESTFTLFGVEWSADEIARMHNAAAVDAKARQFEFSPDSAAKRALATESMRTAIAYARELYDRLEALR